LSLDSSPKHRPCDKRLEGAIQRGIPPRDPHATPLQKADGKITGPLSDSVAGDKLPP
jgi:hypothetical protein